MITSFTQSRAGNTTTITVVSSLVAPVFFHWYVDGQYVGGGTNTRTFYLTPGDQNHIDVLDTTSVSFDPIANAPTGYPPVRRLFFTRSLAALVVSYRIEQQENGGAWSAIGTVPDDPTQWQFSFLTGRLDDLATYAWRVIPIDKYGTDGTAVTLASELIVRLPDAPKFSATFNAGADQVLFAAA